LRELLADSSFSLSMNMLTALAFVPVTDVVASFEELDRSDYFNEHREVLEEYLEYFSKTWLGGFNRRGVRRSPLFDTILWNCREAVLNDLDKTNNFSEGFNRGFLSLLSYSHPSLHKFTSGLLKKQALVVLDMEQYLSKEPSTPRQSQLISLRRLKSAVLKYGEVSTLEFLRGVAHCI